MKYEVKYDIKAEKQLEKLPSEISRRIVEKIRWVGETGKGIEFLKDTHFGYKIRVGDYRVLIDLSYNPDILWVRVIGHRKRIYKGL